MSAQASWKIIQLFSTRKISAFQKTERDKRFEVRRYENEIIFTLMRAYWTMKDIEIVSYGSC